MVLSSINTTMGTNNVPLHKRQNRYTLYVQDIYSVDGRGLASHPIAGIIRLDYH